MLALPAPEAVSTHLLIGGVLAVMGLVVLALQPALKRRLIANGANRTGLRISANVLSGAVILAFGVAFAAGAFSS
ncbi:hypothetical protein FHX74_000080 [Friedmanniella endophytica]|uniref:Uncharacterized protein n=1 Tax=Microlunatus kandeliicorticis TaxID=1759536 RepID=A0A7W3INT9_9ACTN|nr:hypothetical protein [Microlunatus kandeliicorticis]MBA8792486.1 hypothetical protein [Microlunatus kandeliicorticis]